MFRSDSRFTYDPDENALLYFAPIAVDEVQRLIESPAQREERKTGRETVSLEEHEEEGQEVSDDTSLHVRLPRPESVIEKSEWESIEPPGRRPPLYPSEVWDNIKNSYDLPDWNIVRGWFPPPPPNETALRVFYHRGTED